MMTNSPLNEYDERDSSVGLRISLVLIVLVALLGVGYLLARQRVTVYADGRTVTLDTHENRVAGVLEAAGVQLGPGDKVAPDLDTRLSDGMEVDVQRARVVTVDIDGSVRTRRTQADSVAALFDELGVTLAPGDQVIADGVVIWPAPGADLDVTASLPAKITVRRAVPLQVDDDGVPLTINTLELTVGRALQSAGITLYLGDDVRPPLHTRVAPGLEVVVRRSSPVTVEVDGQMIHTRTHQHTVSEFLAELGIALIGQDYALPGLDQPLESGMTVRVVRVLEEIITEQEPIPYDTLWQPDPELEIDNQRLVQQGAPGVLQRRIRIRYENEQEVSRVVEDEWVALEPTSHILAYGSMIVIRQLDTPDGPVEYWRKIRVLATSYSASTAGVAGDDPHFGITATGLPMGKGIVAVDPRVVNLHQKVYVPGYGLGVAADTGGAIKGRRIDLGYDEHNLVLWYSWVDLYLLAPPPDPGKIRYQIGG